MRPPPHPETSLDSQTARNLVQMPGSEPGECTHFIRVLGRRDLLCVDGPPDRRVGAIAATQRSRVARRQLRAAALTDDMIRTRVRSGFMCRVRDGVYLLGQPSPTPFGTGTEALLAVGEDAVLSHLTAAVVWELIRQSDNAIAIHVIARSQRRNRRGIVVHRSITLRPEDVRLHRGLPVTSPARTLLDIAELLPAREVERALDEALARKLVRLAELNRLLARTRNRRGLTVLRQLSSWRRTSAGSRTKWQRRTYKALVAAGLPQPEQDVWWLGYQHDFLWRAHRVTLEIDGYPWHSTKTNMERDRAKDLRVKQAGGDPNRVSNTQVERNIFEVVALVAARLALHDPARRGAAEAA